MNGENELEQTLYDFIIFWFGLPDKPKCKTRMDSCVEGYVCIADTFSYIIISYITFGLGKYI